MRKTLGILVAASAAALGAWAIFKKVNPDAAEHFKHAVCRTKMDVCNATTDTIENMM